MFSHIVARYTCILSHFDIKCTCIVHTCHNIVCSDTIYNILCCLHTRIASFIMQPPVTTVHPVKQGAVYIRMLSNNFYFCVYFIFDIIINDLVVYMGSTLRWLRIMNISICNLHISNE